MNWDSGASYHRTPALRMTKSASGDQRAHFLHKVLDKARQKTSMSKPNSGTNSTHIAHLQYRTAEVAATRFIGDYIIYLHPDQQSGFPPPASPHFATAAMGVFYLRGQPCHLKEGCGTTHPSQSWSLPISSHHGQQPTGPVMPRFAMYLPTI